MPATIWRKRRSLYSFLTHRFKGKSIITFLRLGDKEIYVPKTTLATIVDHTLPEGITMVALEFRDLPGYIKAIFDPIAAQGCELIKRDV